MPRMTDAVKARVRVAVCMSGTVGDGVGGASKRRQGAELHAGSARVQFLRHVQA